MALSSPAAGSSNRGLLLSVRRILEPWPCPPRPPDPPHGLVLSGRRILSMILLMSAAGSSNHGHRILTMAAGLRWNCQASSSSSFGSVVRFDLYSRGCLSIIISVLTEEMF